jgi:hypothetical protein
VPREHEGAANAMAIAGLTAVDGRAMKQTAKER